MRKKRSIAKSRAASLKAHRTIARMKMSRHIASEFVDWIHADEIHGQIGDPKPSIVVPKLSDAEIEELRQAWQRPDYRFALPNPWLELK